MVCRRQAAWSTATFTDAILSSFIIPFGPLLLLSYFDPATFGEADGTDADALNEEAHHRASHDLLQWAAVARLWSQVRLVVGRARNAVGEKKPFICSFVHTWLDFRVLSSFAPFEYALYGPMEVVRRAKPSHLDQSTTQPRLAAQTPAPGSCAEPNSRA